MSAGILPAQLAQRPQPSLTVGLLPRLRGGRLSRKDFSIANQQCTNYFRGLSIGKKDDPRNHTKPLEKRILLSVISWIALPGDYKLSNPTDRSTAFR